MSRRTDLDPARLKRLNHIDGLNLGQIAERYGVGRTTIATHMKAAGIPVMKHGKPLGAWEGARGGRRR